MGFAVLAVVSALVGACSGADNLALPQSEADTSGSTGDGGTAAHRASSDSLKGLSGEIPAGDVPVPIGAPALESSTSNLSSSVSLPGIGQSVIKTADLSVEVPDGEFKDSVRDAVSVAERYGGFVVTTDVSDRERGRGSVVLRIPAESFESALADLHDLGDLQSENISGVDVSQEFVDLEARLRNLESQERVLRRLMNDAVSVSDTLKVQSELQRVQLDIEQIKGRLNYLGDLTDLGTITVGIAEISAVPTKAGVIQKAWKRALAVATGVLTSVIVGAGFVIPMAIMLAIVLLLVVKVRPRFAGLPKA
jgi:hypothetical protein